MVNRRLKCTGINFHEGVNIKNQIQGYEKQIQDVLKLVKKKRVKDNRNKVFRISIRARIGEDKPDGQMRWYSVDM